MSGAKLWAKADAHFTPTMQTLWICCSDMKRNYSKMVGLIRGQINYCKVPGERRGFGAFCSSVSSCSEGEAWYVLYKVPLEVLSLSLCTVCYALNVCVPSKCYGIT